MSRDLILAAVRRYHGDPVALPPMTVGGRDATRASDAHVRTATEESATTDAPGVGEDLVTRFQSALAQVGGTCVERAPGDALDGLIHAQYPNALRLVSTVEEPPRSTVAIAEDTPAAELVRVDLAIVRGLFGVAENGAVWVEGDRLPHRALPFVAEHLVLLLGSDAIVPDMHAAYARLHGRDSGYGVFVSGPSKTADIEQALVIGAQGPRSLLVVLGPAC